MAQRNDAVDFTQSEDIILIIDSGSSAYMEDLAPNRMAVIASAVNLFAEKRLEADKRDRYFLIEGGNQVIEWFADLIDDPKQIAVKIASLVTRPSMAGPEPKLVEAFGKALERHIKTFKTVGNKTLRIIIVGGGNVAQAKENIADLAHKVAARIGVYVDTVKLGVEYPPHSFRTLSEITKGTYHMVTTPEDLYTTFQSLSAKKEVLKPKYVATEQEVPKQKTFLEIIAADLVPVSAEKAGTKCQVCFSVNPVADLRQCPNCKNVLHLPCAGKWAENQNLGFPNVFRCPFCFFLLKVPRNYVDFNKFVEKFQETKKEYQESYASPAAGAEEKPQFSSLLDEEIALTQRREILYHWVNSKMPDANKYQIDSIVEEIIKAERVKDLEAYLRFLREVKGFDTQDFPITS